jgi:hypothetical protein
MEKGHTFDHVENKRLTLKTKKKDLTGETNYM